VAHGGITRLDRVADGLKVIVQLDGHLARDALVKGLDGALPAEKVVGLRPNIGELRRGVKANA